jgi:hypothetical protein
VTVVVYDDHCCTDDECICELYTSLPTVVMMTGHGKNSITSSMRFWSIPLNGGTMERSGKS